MAAKIELTDICAKKSAFLVDKGMIPYGLILQRRLGSGDYERATVDKFGRVQWWKIDGSGKMFAEHAIGELKAQIKILDDLLYEKENDLSHFRAAIKKTLEENSHLADGENCTLIELKRVMSMADATRKG